eukprot:5617030-Pleurochrysis_carterae.AAC.1
MKRAKDKSDGRKFGGIMMKVRTILRGFLCENICTDLDMVNCHPVLLMSTLKSKGQADRFTGLMSYIEERETVLTDIIQADGLDRAAAKQLVIMSMYTNEFISTKSQKMRTLDMEFKRAQDMMIDDGFDDFLKNLPEEKKKNARACYMSRCMTVVEDQLVTDAAQWVREYGDGTYRATALIFDGFHVSKKDSSGSYSSLPEDESRQLCDYLEHKTVSNWNIEMKWAAKPFTKSFTLDKRREEEIRVTRQFTNIISNNVKKIGALFQVRCASGYYRWYDKTQLQTFYSHMVYDKVRTNSDGNSYTTREFFINEVLSPTLIHIIPSFEDTQPYPPPLVAPESCYNSWKDFKCIEYKEQYTYDKEYVRDIIDLISGLTGDDTRLAQFLLHWIYTVVCIPSIKCERIPFISSAPGAGKDTLVSILESMMGTQHLWKCEDSNQLFGVFNPMMENSYLVILSEFDSCDLQRLGKMKHYATCPQITVNMKGKDARVSNSYHKFMVMTNSGSESGTMNMSLSSGERRFVLMHSSERNVGNNKLFERLYEGMKDESKIRSFYEYITKHHEHAPLFKNDEIPLSQFHINSTQIPSVVRFISTMVVNHSALTQSKTSDELWLLYKSWAEDSNISLGKLSKQSFSKTISHIFPPTSGMSITKNIRIGASVCRGRDMDTHILKKYIEKKWPGVYNENTVSNNDDSYEEIITHFMSFHDSVDDKPDDP